MAVLYPPAGFHFRVEFGLEGLNDNDARFQEVSGLTAEMGTEELVEGGETRFTHRLPTRTKYGNLVLKRGFLKDSGLVRWLSDALENYEFNPVDILVTLLNEEHQPILGWTFVGAWPVKWVVSDFKAMENALVVETLEFAYRYFRRA